MNIATANDLVHKLHLGVKTGYDSPILTTDGRYVVLVRSDVEFAVRDLENDSDVDRRDTFLRMRIQLLATDLIRKADRINDQ